MNVNINISRVSNYSLFIFKESIQPSLAALQKKILTIALIAFGVLAAIYVIKRCQIKTFGVLNGLGTRVNGIVVNYFNNNNANTSNIEYLFRSQQEGRSQRGCCGNFSVEIADRVRQKLQEKAAPGISFDPDIYHQCQSIRGTCTAMSLEFASTYFRIQRELGDVDPSSELFLDKLHSMREFFEESSEEMRSRQVAYSSITVDRTVNIDVSRNKIESCVKYHDFEIDYVSEEINITADEDLLQEEINTLPYGVYFVRMLKPSDNHKLEARGHSMIYVNEENAKFFYDNNCGLEKMPLMNTINDRGLYDRLRNVHNQWDIPMTRLYRLKLEGENDSLAPEEIL